MSLKEYWRSASNYIRGELSEHVYQNYIEPLEPVHYDKQANIFVLKAEEEYVIKMIEERYKLLVDKAVRYAFSGKSVKVKIVSDDSEYKNIPSYDFTVRDNYENNYNHNNSMRMTDMSRFSPKYTFDTFVVGSNNRLAHAAALAVAQNPAKKYNPLFIYGGVGLGKTHLMQAIAQEVLKNSPEFNVVYVSSETFTHEFIDAIQKGGNIQFRNKYRNVDMLLIDDIQFLAGKEGTQEEFFHTFNELHMAGKQIILSSDKPPREIPELEERLRSRFEWGLSCDVAPPNFETRIAILKKKAEEENINLPGENEIFEFIAQNFGSNIRELEGALLKVRAIYELNEGNITMDDMKQSLNDIAVKEEKKITAESIIQTVSKYYDVSYADILSSKRTSNVAKARQVGMYLARELTDLSQAGIGEGFGGRDHSTVIHACTKIRSQAEGDMSFDREIKEIINEIKNSNY